VDEQGWGRGTALCDNMRKQTQKTRAKLQSEIGGNASERLSLATTIGLRASVVDSVVMSARAHATEVIWAVFSLVAAAWLSRAFFVIGV